MTTLLDIKNLYTSYGRIPMLLDINLFIEEGDVLCVLGANGAGKTTLVKAILNMVKADSGHMFFQGENIDAWQTYKRIQNGIQVVSSATGTFPKMTIETNIKLGAYYIESKAVLDERMEKIFTSFPVLKNRLRQKAGTLSGGERTMLAIARAIVNNPKLLIMDEPSLGLAPIMVEEVFDVVARLSREDKMSILLVEQNAPKALSVSDFGYVLQKGQILFKGTKSELLTSEFVENPVM